MLLGSICDQDLYFDKRFAALTVPGPILLGVVPLPKMHLEMLPIEPHTGRQEDKSKVQLGPTQGRHSWSLLDASRPFSDVAM